MTDDDWFERALDEEDDENASERETEGRADDERRAADAETDADTGTDTDAGVDTATGADGSSGDGALGDDADPFGGLGAGTDAPEGNPGRDADGPGSGGGDPFGDFGAEMSGASFPGGSPEGGGGGGFDASDGFGGGDAEGFEAAEAEFESDIARVDVGIEGLDEMVLGGVPERSLMAVVGSAGTGKTTFALQFLNEALDGGGKAVYITLEESEDAILSTAEEKGWPYREYETEGRLAVVAMDPVEMANSLDSLRDDISRLVTEFDADRLVLDSVSLLETMYDHPSKRRSEVFDFARSLKRAGVTTMLTSEASTADPYTSRHGIVEYLADAVFVLQYIRPSNSRETRLGVEIQKIRDANHSRETKPYEITDEGISVYRQANIF
ncbi:KaiC domain-containing protein [Candidatus Halobonum tyrrellensis]|uniref:Putative circadian clock protein KaiC n=1 Tax=Candidatus Halobonum tyrrellensis G22 TaxID=1324957 RepID=V4IZ04_9EURY|nr:KaiC domain-containing protein [Candidatus Halobonum tyrrellensis]ESP88352.1 putative circadian clock protein KaiC [Candidatus Halobonum tyrrellensis G22]